MDVVVIGQKWLAAETTRELQRAGVRIVAVSPENIDDEFASMARWAALPFVEFEEIPACSIIVAAHCHRFVPGSVRARAEHGVLAYHPSLLPRHRGRDAIHWTLAMRDPIAGGTVYWMNDGADTGPIEDQDWCHVLPGDTPQTLWRRELGPMGVRLLVGAVTRIARGEAPCRRPQVEAAATWEPAMRRVALKEEND